MNSSSPSIIIQLSISLWLFFSLIQAILRPFLDFLPLMLVAVSNFKMAEKSFYYAIRRSTQWTIVTCEWQQVKVSFFFFLKIHWKVFLNLNYENLNNFSFGNSLRELLRINDPKSFWLTLMECYGQKYGGTKNQKTTFCHFII